MSVVCLKGILQKINLEPGIMSPHSLDQPALARGKFQFAFSEPLACIPKRNLSVGFFPLKLPTTNHPLLREKLIC